MSAFTPAGLEAELRASKAVERWEERVVAAMGDGTDKETLAFYKKQLEFAMKFAESVLARNIAAASSPKNVTCTSTEPSAPIDPPFEETENFLQFLWTTGFTWELVAENFLHVPEGSFTLDVRSSIPGNDVHRDESIFSAVLSSKERKALPFLGDPGIYDWPLYRRASHDRQITEIASLIYDSITKAKRRFIGIFGAPGIGKTVSLVLVLAKVAKMKVDIVCHVQGSETWRHYTPDGTLFIYKSEVIPPALDSPKTLVLYDPATQVDLKSLCIKKAVVCFASSPQDLEVPVSAFYTYSWSDAEFLAIAPHLSLWGPLEERRKIVGNNPRGLLLLAKDVHKLKDKFKMRLSSKPDDMSEICAALLSPGDSFMGFKLSLPPLGQRFSFTHLGATAIDPASDWFDAVLKKHLQADYPAWFQRVRSVLRKLITIEAENSAETTSFATSHIF